MSMSAPGDAMSPLDIAASAERAASTLDLADPSGARDDRPGVLFCCPGSILDVSNGASLSLRTIMAAFARRNFRSIALQATIFDVPSGGRHVLEAGQPQKDKPIWRTHIDGVEHLLVQTGATQRKYMTCQEEETFMNVFRGELRQRRPSFVFLWGGLNLERVVMREARDAGIPVVFYLVNPGYKDETVFRDVSVVVTDSEATAQLYRERYGLECRVLGKFIDRAQVVARGPRKPDFITFINPSFEKGVGLFATMALLAARECPDLRFMVVESRMRWKDALESMKLDPARFPNVHVLPHQFDMRPVFAATRALLVPSVWHESGARVIAEAHVNGIPVIASDTGGSAELIGAGGRVIRLPDELRQDKQTVTITESMLWPWIDELRRVWRDTRYYDFLRGEAEREAEKHDIDRNLDRFINAVAEVCPHFAAIAPQYLSGATPAPPEPFAADAAA